MNPIADVTGAAKAAINPKTILYTLLGLVVIFAAFNFFSATAWLITPVDKFKAWNAARKTA